MKVADYIFFGRPMLLIPVWTVYIHFGAQYWHRSRFSFYWPSSEIPIIVSLTLVFMGTYIVNQIFDVESDRLNDKLYYLPNKIITVASAWRYYIALSICGIGIAYLRSLEAVLVSLMIALLGLAYSMPATRWKDKPVSGLLANAIAYGIFIPAMYGAVTIIGWAGIAIIPYFMAIATGYILTTLPDLSGDIRSGKITVAAVLGYKPTLWLAGLSALSTAGFSIVAHNKDVAVVSILTLAGIIYLLIAPNKKLLLFVCKFPILVLTILAGIYYPPYLLFLLLTIVLTKLYYKKRFGVVYPKLG